ncbi:carbohydrate kinase family protein [Paenibacillus sp. CMAA1364]
MANNYADVVVAGHICLDIIPSFQKKIDGGMDKLFAPGTLLEVGPAMGATGGTVANTGIALHRLGNSVRLMGKVGNDPFGQMILQQLQLSGVELASGMIVIEGEHSSYTIVISPPETDRIFFHHTGTNDTFDSNDVSIEGLEGARLFHFGYPPLMRRMYEQEGEQLLKLLQKVKRAGLTTSLDMAKPDRDSDAGHANWPLILSRVLPYTDLFLPSLEEILYMLDRAKYDELEEMHGNNILDAIDDVILENISNQLLDYGAAIVAIKLGQHGLYLRTTGDEARLKAMGACAPRSVSWLNREILTPCFKVNVLGTTGAGDCTIAGILTTLLQGREPHEVLLGAIGVGACNVERSDATSGIPTWQEVEERIAQGWTFRPQLLQLLNWSLDEQLNIWRSPRDQLMLKKECRISNETK